MIVLTLLQNIALIVLLAAVQQIVFDRWLVKNGLGEQVASGILYGLVGIAAMANPLELSSGHIFDGRSVVLTLAGAFGGPVAAGFAVAMASAYRLWLGGMGAWTGVFVIVTAAGLGVLFHEMARRGLDVMRTGPILGLSLLVHLVMLWGQVFFLGEAGVRAVSQIGLSVITLFPLATLLVAKLILDQRRRLELQRSLELKADDLRRSFDSIIDVIAGMIETRDPYTAEHQQRVARLAVAIAEEIKMSPDEVRLIETAALLHDVGKIAIPTEILAKPGVLTSLERRVVRQHVEMGTDILERSQLGAAVVQTVAQHHERCDGTGYPDGLMMPSISQAARVLMVADVVEAMSSHRPWRASLGIEAALAEIRQGSGKSFDHTVCEACLGLFEGGFAFE